MGLFYTLLFNNLLLIRRKEQQLTIDQDKTLYFDQTPIISIDINGEIQIKNNIERREAYVNLH